MAIMQTTSGRRTLKEAAQMAILGLYTERGSATAGEVAEATREFSPRTAERARADLTAEGMLRHGYTGRPGKQGHHYYEIDRSKVAQFATPRRRSPRSYESRTTQDDGYLWHGEHNPEVDDSEADDADWDDDDDINDAEDELKPVWAAGNPWAGIFAITICVCGLGWAVLVRRRFAPFSIAGANGMPLPPYQTPPTPRGYATVAPYPCDDAIFAPGASLDEDTKPTIGLKGHERFPGFPGFFDFAPESDS
ncbi:MAG: hypothetical protein WAK16_07555 [Candidatus Cybelea sp.]